MFLSGVVHYYRVPKQKTGHNPKRASQESPGIKPVIEKKRLISCGGAANPAAFAGGQRTSAA